MIATPAMIGKRVQASREAVGLSKNQLALAAGVNERTVRNIEAGRRTPSVSTACLLSDALGVTFASLMAL
jgi:transcriptional regulator with XRE-family HTH domain